MFLLFMKSVAHGPTGVVFRKWLRLLCLALSFDRREIAKTVARILNMRKKRKMTPTLP